MLSGFGTTALRACLRKREASTAGGKIALIGGMTAGLLEASAMIFWQKPGNFARDLQAERLQNKHQASLLLQA